MLSNHRIKRKEGIIYMVAWISILFVYLIHLMTENTNRGDFIFSIQDATRTLNVFVPLFCLFAVNNYLLIPRLLMRHKVWTYAVVVTLLTLVAALWQYGDYISAPPHHQAAEPMTPFGFGYGDILPGPPPDRMESSSLLPMPFIHDFVFATLVVGVNLAIAMVSRQIISNIERERLVSANAAGQLEHLKTQINPHFYMNMLNNIHGLVDLNPEKAKEMIMDMSKLMQYMLYDSSKDIISLSSEIGFLKDYLRIMRRRYSKTKVKISEDFPDEQSVRDIKIPPLFFLVFIENAFKHGVDYRYDSYIAISLKLKRGGILFECMNSVPQARSLQLRHGGIGLDNVKKRLSLIYGDKADLEISETSERYTINLYLPIDETANPNNR